MANTEKPTCIVLERLSEIVAENKALKAKIRILTNAVTSSNDAYVETLKKREATKLNSLVGNNNE
jgi:hypothetical protein